MKITGIYTGLFLFLLFSLSLGEEHLVMGGMKGFDPRQKENRYEINLALSGGGARGFAAIGILKAFEENNIDVTAITGTSMGGIIGGLYASGYTPEQLTSFAKEINFDELLQNTPPRNTMFLTQRQELDRHILSIRFDGSKPIIPQALTGGQKLTNILTNLTTRPNYYSAGNFENLPIPFKTICTDIVSGREVILDEGSLADAMRATMAFPLAFTGVKKNGQILMDGGMVTPIPVALIKEMGKPGTFTVAINTASTLLEREKLITPVDIASQATTIMTVDQLNAQLALADYTITPSLGDLSMGDFEYCDSLIEIGYQAGLSAADSIVTLLENKQAKKIYYIYQFEIDPLLQKHTDIFFSHFWKKQLKRNELISRLKSLTTMLNLFELEATITNIDENPSNKETGKTGPEMIILSVSGFPNLRLDELSFQFHGNSIFDDSTLEAQMRMDDTLLTPDNLKEGLERIKSLYYEEKYNLTDIHETIIDPVGKSVTIKIDEAIINEIKIVNNQHTRDWFVRSYFPMKAGQPYSTQLAARGITNIYSTGLFDRVSLDLMPTENGAEVKIDVLEKKYNQLRLGWHWDDEYESEEFVEFMNDNVFGVGFEYLLHTQFSPDRKDFYLSILSNRIGRTYLTTGSKLYHQRLDRQIYDDDSEPGYLHKEYKTGFELSLGQQIARFGTVNAGIEVEELEYKNVQTDTKNKFGLRIFKIQSLVETFNRMPLPESGKKHYFEIQFAGKFLGGDAEFTRFFSSIEAYFPFAKILNFHPKVAIGISRSGLPLSEKFFIGGMRSMAGYHSDELSGDKVFLLNNELRIRLPHWFYITGRYDLGDVYTHQDDIKLSHLRHGTCFILSFNSPIGPFELGYGFNNEDIDRIYFRAGLYF